MGDAHRRSAANAALNAPATRLGTRVQRLTVDLANYPDLVVVYLGMRVKALAGLRTLFRLRRRSRRPGDARPDGLLHCEQNIVGLFPSHVGMRWYWKAHASLEAWTRSPPHREWWARFLRDSGGTGFWHEGYSMRGGMFSARQRMHMHGEAPVAPEGTTEADMY